MVLALNMMDEVRANGGTIMVNELEELLGVPVVPISAAKNEGIDELVEHALHVARHRETPGRIDFCDAGDGTGGAVHRCVHAVAHLIEDHAPARGLPLRFCRNKAGRGRYADRIRAGPRCENETELLGHTIAELESETGLDREAALADMRFNFIERLCDKTVVRPGESREHKRSVAIDTHPDRQIHRPALLYRHYGAGVLADVRCHRRGPVRPADTGHRRAHQR